MTQWTAIVDDRLDVIREQLESSNLTAQIRNASAEVWRANRDRYEPDELYDDPFTISVVSSRNLSNRLLAQLPDGTSSSWTRPWASRVGASVVIHLQGLRIHLVKAPYSCGRAPHLSADFDWAGSELRSAAAKHNDEAVNSFARPSLYDVKSPDLRESVARCRDVFIVWAAELSSGLTAGWVGLPSIQTRGKPWLGITDLWWDAQTALTVSDTVDLVGSPGGEQNGKNAVPILTMTLKDRRKREQGK